MSANERLNQLYGQLNYPKGMLAGQLVLITGGAQGIGAECARLFANEGAKVVISDVDKEKSEEVAKNIKNGGGQALAAPGDLFDDKYIADLIKKAADFGSGKIHIIVNNAGFTWDGVIHKMDDKQWEAMLNLHGTVPFKIIRAAAPYFRVKDGEPRNIVNISSVSGVHGNAGQANYAFAKSGVVGLSKAVAKEWGPQFGVRCNTITFGSIETRLTAAKELGSYMTAPDGTKVALGIPQKQNEARETSGFTDIPLRRRATATEAAAAVLAVASPLMSYVSGQNIEITGGYAM